jgi:hypothetical protein
MDGFSALLFLLLIFLGSAAISITRAASTRRFVPRVRPRTKEAEEFQKERDRLFDMTMSAEIRVSSANKGATTAMQRIVGLARGLERPGENILYGVAGGLIILAFAGLWNLVT